MLSPKLLKTIIAGAVTIGLVGVAIVGVGRISTPVDDFDLLPDPTLDTRIELIDEMTDILVERWCPICNQRSSVPGQFLKNWYGKSRSALTNLLNTDFPGATLLHFSQSEVLVHMPASRCEDCIDKQWPDRGYIGLYQETKMAVFNEHGTVVEIIGPAPGAHIEELREKIYFESAEECEDWIVNLTS